jgi:hypothetical protein
MNNNSSFFSKYKRILITLLMVFVGVTVIGAGFYFVNSIIRSSNTSDAAQTGYGCNQYGTAGGTYGSDCGVIIDASNILNSTICINTFQVTIGNTYTCTFPLTGSTTNTYSVPANGILAGTSTITGQSLACTVIDNITAQAALQCQGIPTAGGVAGVKDVLLFVDGATSGVDKGDVLLVTQSTPLTNGDLVNSDLACVSAPVNSTTPCTFTLPPTKTLPSGFQLAIGNGANGGTCTLNTVTRIVTCAGVPTGSQSGNQLIYSIINGTKGNTTKTVNITAIATTPAPVTNPIAPILPRTGGQWIVSIIAILVLFFGILFGSAYMNKKKSIKTDLDKK